MLSIRGSQSLLTPAAPRKLPVRVAPRPSRCCAGSESSYEERALRSPDARMRRWGLTELVRARLVDGGADASRCSTLARFVRSTGVSDQQALLDAVEEHGATPRMLPVINELMSSRFASVRLRAAPLWGALVGLYNLSSGALDDLNF